MGAEMVKMGIFVVRVVHGFRAGGFRFACIRKGGWGEILPTNEKTAGE